MISSHKLYGEGFVVNENLRTLKSLISDHILST